jgi:hypothetical protein
MGANDDMISAAFYNQKSYGKNLLIMAIVHCATEKLKKPSGFVFSIRIP